LVKFDSMDLASCVRSKKTTPARGHELRPSFIGCDGGTLHPVAHYQVTPAILVPGRLFEFFECELGPAPALDGGSNATDNALQTARLASPAYRDSRVSASSCLDRFGVPLVNREHDILMLVARATSGGVRSCWAIFLMSQTTFTA